MQNSMIEKKRRQQPGNCYAATEALYYILGGDEGDWRPQVMRLLNGGSHWFLVHRYHPHVVVDPSRLQFTGQLPAYGDGHGCGFLTKRPSKRAAILMARLTWKEIDE